MTSADFLPGSENGPETADAAQAQATASKSPTYEKTKAKDVAQYGVLTIPEDSSVYQAIALMVRKDVSGLPVVGESGLVGIISEKDVLKLLYDTEFVAGSVADYMTEDVITFDEEDDLTKICDCLINNSFRRVPILHEGKLAAIITRADLIRANRHKFRPRTIRHNSTAGPNVLMAKDVMKCGLLTIKRYSHVYEAMEIITKRNITGLPVVDDHLNLIGIISEKDMLKLLYDPNAKPGFVRDFMTEDVVGFEANDCLFEICHCLINNNFRRVPILDCGKLVGIISRTDIMQYILKNRTHFFRQKQLSRPSLI